MLHSSRTNVSPIYIPKKKLNPFKALDLIIIKFHNRTDQKLNKRLLQDKRKLKKQNKQICLQLLKVSNEIKDRKSKLVVTDGVFQNLIFRNQKKSLAFERKRVSSPFLFYGNWESPIVLVLILNLVTNKKYNFNFYNDTSYYDI